MTKFQCTKCGRIVEAGPGICCSPRVLCKVRYPECCGQPMIEIVD